MSSNLAITLDEPTREEWLARRRQGIGGSDIAAICGLSPYAGPYDVWLEKKGLREKDETIQMRLGKALEPVIAAEYERETGRRVVLNSVVTAHPKRPWMLATPDGEVQGEPRGVEFKAPGVRMMGEWGAAGTDEAPEHYLVQVAWYMAVRDFYVWDLAALFGNEAFRVYPVTRNRDLEEALIEQGERFWKDHILKNVPPPMDASEAAAEYLKASFPKEIQPLRKATTDEARCLESLFHVRARREEYEKNEELLKNQLKEFIGEATGIEAAGIGRVTWKLTKGSAVTDWKGLAESLKPAPKLIEAHTTIRPGSRRFLPTPAKG